MRQTKRDAGPPADIEHEPTVQITTVIVAGADLFPAESTATTEIEFEPKLP